MSNIGSCEPVSTHAFDFQYLSYDIHHVTKAMFTFSGFMAVWFSANTF